MKAAKLILECKAIRVFSGRVVTGPISATASTMASNVARTFADLPRKWSSRLPSPRQVWV
jgi:hypothetical protein